MRFLIIDDEDRKAQEIIETIKSIEGHENDTFTHKKSRNSGLHELTINGAKELGKMKLSDENRKYDVLILDLNFPLFDKEVPEHNMGIEVLQELRRLKWTIPVIIYSSEPKQLESEYSYIKGYVTYGYYLKAMVESILSTLGA